MADRAGASIPSFAVLPLLLLTAAPQEKPAQPDQPFRAEAAAVTVDVVVRDRQGRPVLDLTDADFELYENGVRQQISSFDKIATDALEAGAAAAKPGTAAVQQPGHPPIRITALVMDRLSIEARALASQAALAYVEQVRPPSELAAVFAVDLSLTTVQYFTSDRDALRMAVDEAGRIVTGTSTIRSTVNTRMEALARAALASGNPNTVAPAEEVGESVPAPDGGPQGDRGGELPLALLMKRMEDAIRAMERDQQGYASTHALLAIIHSMRPLPGRKTIVLFSEGLAIPTAVEAQFGAVIDAANRANVSIYAFDALGLRARSSLAIAKRDIEVDAAIGGDMKLKGLERVGERLRSSPESGLGRLAAQTGGLFITDTNDLRAGMRRIAEDARFHYVLGYTPANQNFDGRYRRIEAKVRRPGVEIRARRGYYALRSAPLVPIRPYEAPAVAALDAPKLPSAFPVRLVPLSFPEPKRPGLTPLLAEVETAHLTFRQQPETELYTSDFTILARFKDVQGEIVHTVSQQYTLRGPVAQIEDAQRGTVLFYKQPDLPPGVYTLEAIVHDALSGKASARVATVEVPKADEDTLRVSSLMIVRRREKVPEKERDPQHPLQYGELLLYPNLGEPLRKGVDNELAFFVTVYPHRPDDRLEASVELLHSGRSLGAVPVTLPPADPSGRIQYVGRLPLDPLAPGVYQLRLSVSGGDHRVSRSAAVRIE